MIRRFVVSLFVLVAACVTSAPVTHARDIGLRTEQAIEKVAPQSVVKLAQFNGCPPGFCPGPFGGGVPGWVLPGASVDLYFSNNLYYGCTTATCLSISRATPATTYAQTVSGTLTSFAANTLRITDLGLLIEESRTNLVLQSQAFGTTWSTGNITVTPDTTVAPDGATTADTLTENTANTSHAVFQNIVLGATTTATFSAYVKAGTRNFVYINYITTSGNWIAAVFDLSNSAATTASQTGMGATSGTINSTSQSALGNGWFRISLTGMANGANGAISIATAPAASGNSFSAFGYITFVGTTSTLMVWGAQGEAGSFPTSYIPTTTTSVTRAADNVTATGALLTVLTSPPLSTVHQTLMAQLSAAGSSARPWTAASAGVSTDGTIIQPTGAGTFSTLVNNVVKATTANAVTPGVVAKSGASFSASGNSAVLNNGTVVTDATAATAGSTSVVIGNRVGLDRALNGYLQRLTAFNSRLSDATLKGFTVP